MKIKKKEYYKQLDDRYWKGVNAGIKFAIDNPETAKNYINRTEALRIITKKASDAFGNLAKNLYKICQGED